MPIISKIGRKSRGTIFAFVVMYTLLIVGSVTMIYPFLLMLSTSITSHVDSEEYKMIPDYLHDDTFLLAKYIEEKLAGSMLTAENRYAMELIRWDDLAKLEDVTPDISAPATQKLLSDWRDFVETVPLLYTKCAFTYNRGLTGRTNLVYQKYNKKMFDGSVDAYNEAYTAEAPTFAGVRTPTERISFRDYVPERSRRYLDFLAFKEDLPAWMRIVIPMSAKYWRYLSVTYEREIGRLNGVWGTDYKDFGEIRLPERLPANPREAKDWEKFVRIRCPYQYIIIENAGKDYHDFLIGHRGNIAAINERYGTAYDSVDQVPLPRFEDLYDKLLEDWSKFIRTELPIEKIRLRTPEFMYRGFLKEKYGTIEKLNQTYETHYHGFGDIDPPFLLADWADIADSTFSERVHFMTVNYREVIDYILLHGRALFNTAVLVILTILTQLTINPMAAYALSRFPLKYSMKVLLFCLATMAFPAEVAMIPGFLLLRDLGFLNTFWALFVPGMANGFQIFLLKGFFDTLPRELYEAAQIDGAGELRLFLQFTMPLCKPVLAVIALRAYMFAYGSFMWAFLVCQDEKMWTLMVWLYQMQAWAPKFLLVASLTLAALPTLIIFIFMQRIIMRGIVLPVFQ